MYLEDRTCGICCARKSDAAMRLRNGLHNGKPQAAAAFCA